MEKGKQLLSKIAERWPVKVLSVVAAIVLFVFHRLGDLEERFFSVPLKLEINNNLVPSSSYPRNIRVTLRGDANSIYPIVESDIEAYLDLTAYEEPSFVKVPVMVRKTGTAVGVENLEIGVEPVEVSLELDVKASKLLRVVPKLQGIPDRGYELVSYGIEPDKMIVEGPRALVNSLTELTTDTIDLMNRNADFSLHIKAVNANPLVSIRGDGMIEFRGIVAESILIRNLENIPIGTTGLQDHLAAKLEPAAGNVRLEAIERSLENFEPPVNFLSVDLSAVETSGIHTLPVTVAVPEGFSLRRQEPLEVTVRITSAVETE